MADPDRPVPSLPPEVQAALDRGDFMAAIKLLRERGGLGLAEAKQAIDRMRRKAEPAPVARPRKSRVGIAPDAGAPADAWRPGMLAPGEVPRSRNRVWFVVVVAAVLYLLWRLLRQGGG